MREYIREYRKCKILVTGHTGFKGAWLSQTLLQAGARIYGYALEPPTDPSLYQILGLDREMESVYGDVRDFGKILDTFRRIQPDIVFHLAAQPIVRESYRNPVYTYQVNVMGTVNVLECVRLTDSVKSVINVTTDKVYKNKEWEWGYRENEELNGYDPYSNSKSCSELVTSSYVNSFFAERKLPVSTMRAGNVIGGGDFAAERIVPDCVRAAVSSREILIRNPHSVRPYQHVLEPVGAYLMVALEQMANYDLAGSYNIGPDEKDCITTGQLAELFCRLWKGKTGENIRWVNQYDGGPHEASYLKLDCSKVKKVFQWNARWDIKEALDKTVELYEIYYSGGDVRKIMQSQIEEYFQNGKYFKQA